MKGMGSNGIHVRRRFGAWLASQKKKNPGGFLFTGCWTSSQSPANNIFEGGIYYYLVRNNILVGGNIFFIFIPVEIDDKNFHWAGRGNCK
jgi:hypothetical protein